MKKIAIVGTCPSSTHLVPFGDPEWEVWACSPGGMALPGLVDQWFELHRYMPLGPSFPKDYCQYLTGFPNVVWMVETEKMVPTSEVFPWEELVRKYGPHFFTSTIAWMFAFAIEMGASHISFFGVDMAAKTEYKDQKLGLHYFATLAKLKGIEVYSPPESDLFCPAPLYAICQHQHGWIKQTSKLKELNGRIANAKTQLEQVQYEVAFLEGAADEQDYEMRHWFGGVDHNAHTTITVGEELDKIKELQIHEPEHAENEPTSSGGDKDVLAKPKSPKPKRRTSKAGKGRGSDKDLTKYPPHVT